MMYVEDGEVVIVEMKGDNNRGEKTRRKKRQERLSRERCDDKNQYNVILINIM
jgi:hypothetical protein